jgi:hypothetical protein
MNDQATPLPALRTSPSGPLRRLSAQRRANLLVVMPVVLIMLLSSFAAHAQGRPGGAPARMGTDAPCEVCIPEDYAQACDEAAQDAEVYWGEAAAMRKHARELEERTRRLAVEAELARRDAEAQAARGWWMFAGGSAASVLVLVAVYALAN